MYETDSGQGGEKREREKGRRERKEGGGDWRAVSPDGRRTVHPVEEREVSWEEEMSVEGKDAFLNTLDWTRSLSQQAGSVTGSASPGERRRRRRDKRKKVRPPIILSPLSALLLFLLCSFMV